MRKIDREKKERRKSEEKAEKEREQEEKTCSYAEWTKNAVWRVLLDIYKKLQIK